jgi:hypothetical protein
MAHVELLALHVQFQVQPVVDGLADADEAAVAVVRAHVGTEQMVAIAVTEDVAQAPGQVPALVKFVRRGGCADHGQTGRQQRFCFGVHAIPLRVVSVSGPLQLARAVSSNIKNAAVWYANEGAHACVHVGIPVRPPKRRPTR